MDKILDIVDIIASENGLQSELVLGALKESIIKMAKKEINEDMNFAVVEDKENRDLKLTRKILVVGDENYDEALSSTQMSLSQAMEIAPNAQINDEIEYQIDLNNVSNNGINGVFFDIKNSIQKLNERQLVAKHEKFLGKIVSGRVIFIDEHENTFVEIDSSRATLMQKNRIKGETFKVGSVVKAILKFVGFNKGSFYLELSRTTPKMIEELLKLEVPEIKDGDVEVVKIARIPGVKAKVLLKSKKARIDAVGSAVGNKGVRIMSIGKELNGENIDCIEHTSVPELLVQRVLSPARVNSVKIDDELNQAVVEVFQSQKSKAIGKAGVNIRLANMLTGYDIQLKEIQDLHMTAEGQAPAPQKDEKVGLQALEYLFKK